MTQTYKYREIYLKLKQDILSQKYNSHEKLPSKRQLSIDQNVSINTVKNAYEQLLLRVIFIQRKDKVTLLKH